MFGFIKKMFIRVIGFVGSNKNIIPLKCVSMNNQECKIRPAIMDINSNGPLFYHYSVLVNNAVAVVMILIIHMLNYVFLMLLKT